MFKKIHCRSHKLAHSAIQCYCLDTAILNKLWRVEGTKLQENCRWSAKRNIADVI